MPGRVTNEGSQHGSGIQPLKALLYPELVIRDCAFEWCLCCLGAILLACSDAGKMNFKLCAQVCRHGNPFNSDQNSGCLCFVPFFLNIISVFYFLMRRAGLESGFI